MLSVCVCVCACVCVYCIHVYTPCVVLCSIRVHTLELFPITAGEGMCPPSHEGEFRIPVQLVTQGEKIHICG